MLELISIHIPKTAGRSFVNILESVYGQMHLAHFDKKKYVNKPESGIELFKNDLSADIKVIHGHFYFNEIKSLIDNNNVKVITWMRDPVERVISNYSFFKKRIAFNPENIELQRRKNETLVQYAKLENSINRMSKFIEGMNIKDFYFIGIVEQFSKDIRELAGNLNWKSFEVPRINDNRDFKNELPGVSILDRELIKKLNQQDVELYNQVIEFRNINN